MKTITVKFAKYGANYAYLSDIEGIEVGDTVVIDTPSTGFTCVSVFSVQETAESVVKATKWIVCKVDTEAYQERLRRQERRAVIVAKLQKLQKEVLEANQFAELAKLSPEAAALVDELKSL